VAGEHLAGNDAGRVEVRPRAQLASE
jgi:hypothetical protein